MRSFVHSIGCCTFPACCSLSLGRSLPVEPMLCGLPKLKLLPVSQGGPYRGMIARGGLNRGDRVHFSPPGRQTPVLRQPASPFLPLRKKADIGLKSGKGKPAARCCGPNSSARLLLRRPTARSNGSLSRLRNGLRLAIEHSEVTRLGPLAGDSEPLRRQTALQ